MSEISKHQFLQAAIDEMSGEMGYSREQLSKFCAFYDEMAAGYAHMDQAIAVRECADKLAARVSLAQRDAEIADLTNRLRAAELQLDDFARGGMFEGMKVERDEMQRQAVAAQAEAERLRAAAQEMFKLIDAQPKTYFDRRGDWDHHDCRIYRQEDFDRWCATLQSSEATDGK